MNVKTRSIPMAIIFSIITCGIYGLYWQAVITDDVNYMLDRRDTSGGMCVLLSIVTCGIYGYYWAYKMGEKVAELKARRAQQSGASNVYYESNDNVLFLILQIIGLAIVNYCLIQSAINDASTM